jgi:hypothetical protein
MTDNPKTNDDFSGVNEVAFRRFRRGSISSWQRPALLETMRSPPRRDSDRNFHDHNTGDGIGSCIVVESAIPGVHTIGGGALSLRAEGVKVTQGLQLEAVRSRRDPCMTDLVGSIVMDRVNVPNSHLPQATSTPLHSLLERGDAFHRELAHGS